MPAVSMRFLDRDDRFHTEEKRLLLKSEAGGLALVKSSYVLHESWALIQARLGWDAVEDFCVNWWCGAGLRGSMSDSTSSAQRERGKPGNAGSASPIVCPLR
jgi:hypothetical protein